MKTYKTLKIGQFRSETLDSEPAKTYVLYGVKNHTVAVIRYFLLKDPCPEHTVVKVYKGMSLCRESMHFKMQSFVDLFSNVFHFMDWNTQINQR